MKYFVMLVSGDGSPVTLLDCREEYGDTIRLYDTKEEAENAAEQTAFGQVFGYEVMEWDWMEED